MNRWQKTQDFAKQNGISDEALRELLVLAGRTVDAEKMVFTKIACLDQGFVELVDYMGGDKTIENAARCSYTGGEAEDRTQAQTERLIRLLLRSGHTTPFEQVELTFRVKVPMFIWRQWIRHRTAHVNEISGRYTPLPTEFYVPEAKDISKQATSNKQGRDSALVENPEVHRGKFEQEAQHAFELYQGRRDDGMANELSRINLPLSTYTLAVWKIDLHNLLHFLRLRLDPHAQYEIRVYAEALADIVSRVCPMAWDAFEDYKRNAITLSSAEQILVRAALEGSEVDFERVGMTKREINEFLDKINRMGIEAKVIEDEQASR